MRKLYNKICTNIEAVINYDKAKADDFKGWCLHHVLETHTSDWICRPHNARLSRDELIVMDMYYNRPPTEFIFLTKAEHNRLHNYSKKGKKMSQKAVEKMKASQRKYYETHDVWNKGVARTDEEKQKISERTKAAMANPEIRAKITTALKGKKLSEEHKKRISEGQKGSHFYNNGVKTIKAFECPEGFVPGMIKRRGK